MPSQVRMGPGNPMTQQRLMQLVMPRKRAPGPHGVQTPHPAIPSRTVSMYDAARRAIAPAFAGFASDPTNIETGPLMAAGHAAAAALPAIFKASPGGKALRYSYGGYKAPSRSREFFSPGNLQNRPLTTDNAKQLRRVAVRDPNQPIFQKDALYREGGDLAGVVDYRQVDDLGPRTEQAIHARTGMVGVPEGTPRVYVEWTGSADETNELYGGAALDAFAKRLKKDYGKNQTVVVEAKVVQPKLQGTNPAGMREASGAGRGSGLSARSVVFDPDSGMGAFFVRNGKLISVKKGVETLGGDISKITDTGWDATALRRMREEHEAFGNPLDIDPGDLMTDAEYMEAMGDEVALFDDYMENYNAERFEGGGRRLSYEEALEREADEILARGTPVAPTNPTVDLNAPLPPPRTQVRQAVRPTEVLPQEHEQLLGGRTAPWTEAEGQRLQTQRQQARGTSEQRYPTREEIELMLRRRGYADY